jgi:hypothetical protein
MIIADLLFAPYLEKGEKILKVFHRHPFVMLPDLLQVLFFGFLIPLFLFYLFPSLWFFFVVWLLVSLVRIVYILFSWYHDVILVSNVSLLAVQWNGFFDRLSSRLEYQQIDGSSSSIRGLRQTIFNYGDLQIAHGSGMPLILRDAIAPKSSEKTIMMFQEKFTSDQNLKDAGTLKTLLSTMLRHHAKTEGIPEQE